MKNMNFIVLSVFAFIVLGCNEQKSKDIQKKEAISNKSEIAVKADEDVVDDKQDGFLYVNIKELYNSQKRLALLNEQKDTLAFFKGKNVSFNNDKYDIINEEHLYKKNLKVNTYYPEYGLFILDCDGSENGYYEVKVNNIDCYIKIAGNQDLLKFKTPEKHLMESYPYLYGNKNTPLRKEPSDKSEIIEGYSNHLYIPVEIKGDWLKVRDDKDCYIGEEPSKDDIVGWVRWRKDGEIIIDIRHSC